MPYCAKAGRLLHKLSLRNKQILHMCIQRFHAVCVQNAQIVAIAGVAARCPHIAGKCRKHRCALRGSQVCSCVKILLRRFSPPIARGDRQLPQRAAQRQLHGRALQAASRRRLLCFSACCGQHLHGLRCICAACCSFSAAAMAKRTTCCWPISGLLSMVRLSALKRSALSGRSLCSKSIPSTAAAHSTSWQRSTRFFSGLRRRGGVSAPAI